MNALNTCAFMSVCAVALMSCLRSDAKIFHIDLLEKSHVHARVGKLDTQRGNYVPARLMLAT